MSGVSSCACKVPVQSVGESSEIPNSEPEEKVPGWWKVGLHLLKKSPANSSSKDDDKPVQAKNGLPLCRRVGRPRKRRRSVDSDPPYEDESKPKKKRGRPRKETAFRSRISVGSLLHVGAADKVVESVVEALHAAFLNRSLQSVDVQELVVENDVVQTMETLLLQVEQKLSNVFLLQKVVS